MVLPFDTLRHPLVIAHRGSMVLGPENTLYTFELADSAGADVLEMDVHPSSDGSVMVIHDEEIDRTSNGSGPVHDHTVAELKRLDFAWNFRLEDETFPLRGQGVTVPTLDEVFERFPGRYFSIDVKENDPGLATEVVKLVLRHDLRDHVILGSFHPQIAELLRTVMPPLHVAADRPQALRLLAAAHTRLPLSRELPSAYMLPDHVPLLPVATRRLIRTVHRLGRRCYFWGVDDEGRMRRVLERGADGIVTNRPELLFAVREKLKGSNPRGSRGNGKGEPPGSP